MNYDKNKSLCRESWREEYSFLGIDRSEMRDQGRSCICNENKNTYNECFPETKPVWLT